MICEKYFTIQYKHCFSSWVWNNCVVNLDLTWEPMLGCGKKLNKDFTMKDKWRMHVFFSRQSLSFCGVRLRPDRVELFIKFFLWSQVTNCLSISWIVCLQFSLTVYFTWTQGFLLSEKKLSDAVICMLVKKNLYLTENSTKCSNRMRNSVIHRQGYIYHCVT